MSRFYWFVLLTWISMTFVEPTFAANFSDLPEPFGQCLLRQNSDGSFDVLRMEVKYRTEAHTRSVESIVQVEENGTQVTKKVLRPETFTVTKAIEVPIQKTILADDVVLFDLKGQQVKPSQIRDRFQKPGLVLISPDGKIHPSFSAIFKPDTLVLSSRLVEEQGDSQPPNSEAVPSPIPGQAPTPVPSTSNEQVKSGLQTLEGNSTPFSNDVTSLTVSLQTSKNPPNEVNASNELTFPEKPSPVFRYCRIADKDTVEIRYYGEFQVTLTAMREEMVKGVIEKIPFQFTKTIRDDHSTNWPRQFVKFTDLDGTPLGNSGISSLQLKEATVVVSGDGTEVDTFWLQNVKPGVPVVLLSLTSVKPPSVDQPGSGSAESPKPIPTSES